MGQLEASQIKSYLNDIENDKAIAIIWTIDDVFQQAQDSGVSLSIEEAKRVLNYLDRKHDATIGISWDVIDTVINIVISERERRVS